LREFLKPAHVFYMRKVYRKQFDGSWAWEDFDNTPSTAVAPAVHQDTLKQPIRDLVTGKMHDSTSAYLREVRSRGDEVVGNDLMSRRPQQLKEHITESMVMDRIERAESIQADPAKFRARQNENLERLERRKKLLGLND
jgi:hypothetical protein